MKEDRLFLIWSESLSQELEQWKGAPLRYRPQSLLRGWQLMALLCEVVAPSDEFLPFVLHFLQTSGAA